jgi:hypothetical protein
MSGPASQMARTTKPRTRSTITPMAMSRYVTRLSHPVAKPGPERAFLKLLVVPATRSHIWEPAEKLVALFAPDSFCAGVEKEVTRFAMSASSYGQALDKTNQVTKTAQPTAQKIAVAMTRLAVMKSSMRGKYSAMNNKNTQKHG